MIPSIDLAGGKAVRLAGGDRPIFEAATDPRELARELGRYGEIAVIDLDAARGTGENTSLALELCRIAAVRFGGGLRTTEQARKFLRAGARAVMLGTAADERTLAGLPKERVIVALDTRAGRVETHGWTQSSGEPPLQRMARLADRCSGFLFTSIERDGSLSGPDLSGATALRAAYDGPLTVAGGVRSIADLQALDELGCDAQVGLAIYAGRLDPAEAFSSFVRFEPQSKLVPTIVCDASNGAPRMLAYSCAESLKRSLREGTATYWSRSRGRLWMKGETSGNVQRVRSVRLDCDRDTLAFFVDQTGPTCHLGSWNCFGSEPFSWQSLEVRVTSRASARPSSSYTAALSGDADLLERKIAEEARELCEARTHDEVAWEAADLLYFMTVKLAGAGVSVRDVLAQLEARAR